MSITTHLRMRPQSPNSDIRRQLREVPTSNIHMHVLIFRSENMVTIAHNVEETTLAQKHGIQWDKQLSQLQENSYRLSELWQVYWNEARSKMYPLVNFRQEYLLLVGESMSNRTLYHSTWDAKIFLTIKCINCHCAQVIQVPIQKFLVIKIVDDRSYGLKSLHLQNRCFWKKLETVQKDSSLYKNIY